jgi:hypothetical protein
LISIERDRLADVLEAVAVGQIERINKLALMSW